MTSRRGTRSTQRGASLVTALVLLAALSLIGAAGVMIANSQFKMASNLQFQSAAMTDAESALAVAENWLPDNSTHQGFADGTVAGLYPFGVTPDPMNMKWDDTNSIRVDAAGNQRYLVEHLGARTIPSNSVTQCGGYGSAAPCAKVNLYRVSTRGESRQGATRIVQSLFTVRVN